jgi:hypothetical protein
MSESVDITQLNASWRVQIVVGGKWGRGRCWLLEKLVDNEWRHVTATRSRAMLEWLVVPADADTAAQLAALPPRSDYCGEPTIRGKRAQALETKAAAAAALKHLRRASLAERFLSWRSEQAGRSGDRDIDGEQATIEQGPA